MVDAALQNADFDRATLEKLHDEDYADCLKQTASRMKEAKKLLKQRLKAQKAFLRKVVREKRYEYERGNPVRISCLSQATSITSGFETFENGGVVTLTPNLVSQSPSAFNNLTTFAATCNGPQGFAGLEVVSLHDFEYLPREDGLLDVTAFFAPVGSFSMAARGGCLFAGVAVLSVTGQLSVRPVEGADFGPPIAQTEVDIMFSAEADADCAAATSVGIFNFDNESFSVPLQAPVVVRSTDRLFCLAKFTFQMIALHATSVVDLASVGLNVPVVLARLES